ncbi:retinal short-chain dehydrogenase/reductase [Lentinus tigrinus ALCF2SS1-7]|uniref:Short-chain dehydrogenase/reductase 3 n=1 Tax=Lentinus tigrinus ALCF2SS1-6 TaxID=1328759 RepID=A0A5C2STM2_9APHY|nr:retinal short-chain dehydrogenase/reductase [Lentinus tigrinus ALCF2SS1-6]RPD80942.1 retinal short-chain dehydrogenase/reductase [Lentinus tigrinus ALCF2SS1-7]
MSESTTTVNSAPLSLADLWDPLYDSFDVDLIVKVLSHTAFSPFFTFFIPLFFYFQGARWPEPVLVLTAFHNVAVSAFWFLKWYSRLYRNQGNLLFGPGRPDWGEQLVVITGGSSGIGELIANTLAVRNVTVVVLDVKPIVTENYNITYYQCDVSKWEDVERVSKQIVEELGHPTMLINNAGVVQGKALLDLSPQDVQQTFAVNTLAHFWTLKAFLPEMIKQKTGHIVNVSSVSGMVGMARLTDYGASKAALINLHESLRYELDHVYNAPGVRTTLVVAGHIMTPLFATVRHPKSFFYKFFFPSLMPVDVAKAIIAALDEQHSLVLYMPFYAHFVPLLHMFPSYLRDLAQWVTGCDYAMQDFVKISGRRSEEGPAPAELEKRAKSF